MNLQGRCQLFNFIKRLTYFNNVLWVTLFSAVMILPSASAEIETETASIVSAVNGLMSKGVDRTSLSLQPTFDGISIKSVDSSRATESAPTPFIIGGTTTSRDRYRDYALVIITDGSGNITGLCGGTVIASNKVLTAAHCAQERASRYFTIPGFYAFSDRLQQSDLFPVSRVAAHPEYNPSTIANDVAVLTLTRDYFTQISPVLSGSDKLAGTDGTVIGTGLTATNPRAEPNALQEVLAPITSNLDCNDQWESFTGIRPIESNMMCAGFTTDGRGSCSGDSGGPLFIDINGQRVVAGTVSFGFGQCELNRATQGYARMTSMTGFIRSESPDTVFVRSNTLSLSPIMNLLLDEENTRSAPVAGQQPMQLFPSLPARLNSGTDLVVAVLGDENDTIVGTTAEVFHLNSLQNGAQMVFQDIGLDEVNVIMRRPGSSSSYEFWIRTPQATFPFADLAVGTYAPAVPISVFSDDTMPSITFSDNNQPCSNSGNGSFTITRISNNGDPFASTGPIITEVEGRFEVSCSDDGGKIRGRFRYAR